MCLLNKSTTFILRRSFNYRLKESKNHIKALVRLACFWQYRLNIFNHNKITDAKFYYFGRKSQRDTPISMLGLDSSRVISKNNKQYAFISEIPIPGSVCIPHSLSSIIPLKDRSLGEVLLGFEKRKRRLINNSISGFLLTQVTDINEVTRLNQEMLKPYASARYGEAVYQLPLQQVMEMALKTGQLHLLLEDGKEVGCLIGFESISNNKRYWHSYRGGFPDFIFNDSHNYREKNVIITYLQVEWALKNGYDYYDMGHNSADTERGVVHFKRTFGAELSVRGNHNYIFLRLPKAIAAKFYWEKPVFAVEGKSIVLHLGSPDKISADELANRYKLLNYNGLSKIYLHCDSVPSSKHTEAIVNIYSYQKSPPVIIIF